MMNAKRTRVLLHLLGGGILVATSVLADYISAQPRVWGLLQSLTLVTGLGMIAIGFLLRHQHLGVIARVSTNLCLSLLSLFVVLMVAEAGFRVVGFDFAGRLRAWLNYPPYYRQPIAPTGTVFFKRPGAEQWTGQVLNTVMKQRGVLPNPYENEPVITVEYDRRGFRNPDHMSDWEIAVAGDSFTEQGNLPYHQLFTSILARRLNVSVLNLGTSYTGPLTQLSYLEDYGIAESTKHTVIVFFEGNDLKELATEYAALVRWRETGQRDYREFKRETSLLRTLHKVVGPLRRKQSPGIESTNPDHFIAYFRSSQGDIPVTFGETPPSRGHLSKETMHHLNYFFTQYADFGKDRQITIWLAYMPSKRRILHGQIDFSASATEAHKNWQPSELPKVISGLCDQHGIRFIDLTPKFNEETSQNNQLLYNSVYDIHLNSHGSLIVGQELARHFLRQEGFGS